MAHSVPSHEAPIALISGGLGDIGQAIAHSLHRAGHRVALGDLPDPATAAQRRGPWTSDTWHYAQVDVRSAAAVERWVEEVARHWGAPTITVVNAAVFTQCSLLDMTPADFANDLAVNLQGGFHLAQAAARRMRAQEHAGHIVFIGSWAAEVPHPNVPAYAVSKAGLRMLMHCLAAELAPHGILVNEIAPGYVNAGLSARIFAEQPDVAARCRSRVPTRRLIEPEEIAQALLHLCAPVNRNQTGSVVRLDGGLTLGPLANGV